MKTSLHVQNKILSIILVIYSVNQLCVYILFSDRLKISFMITLILSVIYLIIGGYVFFINSYVNRKIDILFKLPKQLFVISLFILLFLVTAYVSPSTQIAVGARIYLVLNSAIIFCFGMLICWGYVLYLKSFKIDLKKLLTKKAVVLVCSLGMLPILFRLPMINTLQRWDAGEYYYALGNACQSFTYSLADFFNNFRLCNHTTLGFSLLMAPGEFLHPRGITGVLLISLFLTVGSIGCLYYLLRQAFTDISWRYSALVAFVYSIVPFFLGSFGYLTPDYIVPVIFIFSLMAEYKKEYLLQFFWLMIIANTKEFSIIIIFGYFFSKMFYVIVKNIYDKKKLLKALLCNASLWTGFLSGISYLLILYFQGGVLWKGGNPDSNTISFSNTGINCFGINFSYILFRLKQHLVLNFAWIFTVLLAVCIISLIIRKKKSCKRCSLEKKEILISVCGSLITALLSNMIYITAGAYRYCTFFFTLYPVFVLLFCHDMIYQYILKKRYRIFLTIIIFLLLIESYIHIDPVSKKVFDTASTGSWYTVLTNYEHTNFGNDLCNNYQYTFIDKSFDKMLKEIDYDASQDIILVGNQGQGSQLKGNGDYYKVCWDKSLEKRVIYDERKSERYPELIPINILSENILEEMSETYSLSQSAVVFFVPYYNVDEKSELEYLSNYYLIGARKEVKSVGGSVFYYELDLREK